MLNKGEGTRGEIVERNCKWIFNDATIMVLGDHQRQQDTIKIIINNYKSAIYK